MRAFLRDERGVALLDMVVVCALIALFATVFATVFGLQPQRTHSSAIFLEEALSEARSLAAANSNVLDPGYATGSMVVIEADAKVPNASTITVYKSRPVIIGGKQLAAPVRDFGFPIQRVPAHFTFSGAQTAAGIVATSATIAEPFAIMLSGGGYASIQQLNGPYNAAAPTFYSQDPGCNAATATITTLYGAATESHPFGCTGGAFHVN